MYLKALLILHEKKHRLNFIKVAKKISRNNKINYIKVIISMLSSAYFYGTTAEDYYDFDFIHRTSDNKKTYITSYLNFKLFSILNKKEYRKYFHDKVLFNQRFDSFIGREWTFIGKQDYQYDLEHMINQYDKIIVKNRFGDSGRQVKILYLKPDSTAEDIVKNMRRCNLNLAEEVLTNHPVLNKLNPSSLNTLRIVTILIQKKLYFIYAGVRIGAKDAEIDNLSQGGTVARVDIETGVINSKFYASKYKEINNSIKGLDVCDLQLPMWDEVLSLVAKAANIIPEVGYVGWDVAITPDGPYIIEGNESFASDILQVFYNSTERGIKPILDKVLSEHGLVL